MSEYAQALIVIGLVILIFHAIYAVNVIADIRDEIRSLRRQIAEKKD